MGAHCQEYLNHEDLDYGLKILQTIFKRARESQFLSSDDSQVCCTSPK